MPKAPLTPDPRPMPFSPRHDAPSRRHHSTRFAAGAAAAVVALLLFAVVAARSQQPPGGNPPATAPPAGTMPAPAAVPEAAARGNVVVRAFDTEYVLPTLRVDIDPARSDAEVLRPESPLENPARPVRMGVGWRATVSESIVERPVARCEVRFIDRNGLDLPAPVADLDLGDVTPGRDETLAWDGAKDFGDYEFTIVVMPRGGSGASAPVTPDAAIARSRPHRVRLAPSAERVALDRFEITGVFSRTETLLYERAKRRYYRFTLEVSFEARLRAGLTPADVEVRFERRGERALAPRETLPEHLQRFDPDRDAGAALNTGVKWRLVEPLWPPPAGDASAAGAGGAVGAAATASPAPVTWDGPLARGVARYGYTVAAEHFPLRDTADLRLVATRRGQERVDRVYYVALEFACAAPADFAEAPVTLHLPAALTARAAETGGIVPRRDHREVRR
ncbi:MAG: hypothetical protein HY719_16830 [Planctomycetes bacterium]|nr:hypothetical protein [Planctomycetota bacterium]